MEWLLISSAVFVLVLLGVGVYQFLWRNIRDYFRDSGDDAAVGGGGETSEGLTAAAATAVPPPTAPPMPPAPSAEPERPRTPPPTYADVIEEDRRKAADIK